MIFTQKIASQTCLGVYFDNLIIKVFAWFYWLGGPLNIRTGNSPAVCKSAIT